MGIKDYYIAKELIEGLDSDFSGEKPESLVVLAENTLGLKFPPSYRQFLLDFGCGGIDDFDFEVYGIVNDNFVKSTIPNGIWLTLQERKDINLDPTYIIIGDVGDGSYYTLDTRIKDADGENPVVIISVEYAKETIASSFGTYLLNEIRQIESEL